MTLELPWPPSVNRAWRSVGGKVLLSRECRDYRRAVMLAVALSPQRWTKFSTGERLAVVVHAFPPDKRRRDIANLDKALMDAIQEAGVIGDDSQVDDLHIVRKKVVKGGKVRVSIMELEQNSDVESK